MIDFQKKLLKFFNKEINISFIKSSILTLIIIVYGMILLLMYFLFHIHFVGINGLLFIILASFFHGMYGGIYASIWVSGIMTMSVLFNDYNNLYIIVSSIIVEFLIGISLGKGIDIYKKQKLDLQVSEKKFRKYIENAPIGVFVADKEGNFIEVNDKGVLMINYTRAELLNMSVFDISSNKIDLAETVFEILKKRGKISFEGEFINKSGKKFNAKINAIKINNDKFLGFVEDITARKTKENEIRYLSFHDQLTGLYNRRYFENEMERLNKSRKLPTGIIIGDIDDLKNINDNYGHKVGDDYIKKASEIFNLTTRNEDIVARIGGDEFAIILPETGYSIARKLCVRLANECCKLNKKCDLSELLKISFGCAVKDNQKQKLKNVFEIADQEMYKRKYEKAKIQNKS